MKQIYDFEGKTPPPLDGKKLKTLMERRALQRQAAALAASGVLMQLCLLCTAFLVRFENPLCAVALLSHAVFSLAGFAAVCMIINAKRGKLKCVLPF